MPSALIHGRAALLERLVEPTQVPSSDPAAELPPYVESFLAHLRLLVGVPFEYMVPDARLLPPESIRFFHLDRSWTDRLVDGALAVGELGSREQALHRAHHGPIRERLDVTQRDVRSLQRGRKPFALARTDAESLPGADPEGRITGLLLRSAAVTGWPDMDVRAYDTRLPEPIDPTQGAAHRLRTLRQERLSPSVLLALFEGTPALVVLEEPHRGVMLGVQRSSTGYEIRLRGSDGRPLTPTRAVVLPVRTRHPRVVAVDELRRRIHALAMTDLQVPSPRGSGDLAVQLTSPPGRQRFEGRGGRPPGSGPGSVGVADGLRDPNLAASLEQVIR